VLCLGIFRFAPLLCAEEGPDSEAMAAAGRMTRERLEREPASWTTVFELQRGAEAHVATTLAPNMRRVSFSLHGAGQSGEIASIVERDGFWYVVEDGQFSKYRPYEAPLRLPALNLFLAKSIPAVVDRAEPVGTFLKLEGGTAVYQTPLAEPIKRTVQASLDAFRALERQSPAAVTGQTTARIKDLESLLAQGTETRVATDSGIVQQSGAPGKRIWIRDFRWLAKADEAAFDVAKRDWNDRSSNLFEISESANDVIMISNLPGWRRGMTPGDMDVLLLNIKSGELRRLPFAFGIAGGGCFSADRKRAYVSGVSGNIADGAFIGLFEIDLASGENRRLGGPELQTGMVMFPTLSPGGNELAVLHVQPDVLPPLHAQVRLFELEQGTSTPLGDPLDTGPISWLPNADGIVLVSREAKALSEPAIGTVCRMDRTGKLSPLCKGVTPTVLLPRSRILFQEQASGLWKTCGLSGEDVTTVGDGLKRFGFPAPSPEGDRAIMMYFDAPEGPQPHIVDLATGETTPLSVGPGLWGKPYWR
jgi:hypothetical protein